MSMFAKLFVLYFTIAIVLKLTFPEFGISHRITEIVNVNGEEIGLNSTTMNSLIATDPGSVMSYFIGALVLVWNFVMFMLDALTFPFALYGGLVGYGAPPEVAMLPSLLLFAILLGAIVDFIRSGV